MVGYARHNIRFRKSCAHFKIFHSVEILYCKLYPTCVRVRVCVCVCFQNSNNSQLHKPTESSGMPVPDDLTIIENSWNSYDFNDHVGYTCKCQWWPLLFEVAFSNIKNPWIIDDSQLSIFLIQAIPSLISNDQRFPRIIDVAPSINFWLGIASSSEYSFWLWDVSNWGLPFDVNQCLPFVVCYLGHISRCWIAHHN